MFDLFRSQKQLVRYFLGAILLLVAFSMVITLIPGIFGTPADVNQVVLAKVDDKELTLQEAATRFRDLQLTRLDDPQSFRLQALNTIDNLIMEKALLEEAETLGLMPDEEELVEWLKLELPFLFPNGVFVGRDQYAAFVRQRFQRSIPEFEEALRRDLAINTRLRRFVTSNVVVTDEELREVYRELNQEAKVEYVKLEIEDFEDMVNPSEEQLREYFEANKAGYRIPEKRSIKLMTIEDSELPEPEITDADIETYYIRNRSLYEQPERVKASHILFMTTDMSEEEIAEIEAKAKEVLEKVKGGADFAALAEEHSEDPGSAEEGGSLGWITRGEMVQEFEDAVFSMEGGEISQEPVKTEFGLHIIKVEEKENARLRPLDEVREEIRERVLEERRQTERVRLVDEAVATARRFGKDLEQAGEELGYPVKTLEPFERVNPPEELAGQNQFVRTLFGAAEGEVLSSAQEGTTLVAVVDEIMRSREAEFEEVRDSVRSSYVREQAQQLATQRAQEVFEQAQEQSLARAAGRYGFETETTDFFTPEDQIEGLGTAGVVNQAFGSEPGTVLGPVPGSMGAQIVYRVVERREADMSGFEDERDELRDRELRQRRNAAFDVFALSTRQRYQQEGKVTRYQDRIDSFLQSMLRRG